ncbi:MAG TPA: DUF721 domain-containing protein [Pirellulaceae bacterium]|nr:DUF721 domain-containing protein [Pirellulaceae bacterium]HMO91347.1 DUF721 domain-containing protein [Pirellulaceae bacterium]HMP70261.1 DUF721 domain-containing protein [Pirellulaceae bacterium]
MRKTKPELEFEYRAAEIIRNQRFQRRPKTAGQLINALIASSGFAATKQNEQIEQAWFEVVGEKIAKNTRLGSIRKGKLQVYLQNASVKQHLTMIKSELISALKQRIPGVTDIQLNVR